MASHPEPAVDTHKLRTFAGVFTPSILTILGIMLFLRLGYVVGSAGQKQSLVIIPRQELAKKSGVRPRLSWRRRNCRWKTYSRSTIWRKTHRPVTTDKYTPRLCWGVYLSHEMN